MAHPMNPVLPARRPSRRIRILDWLAPRRAATPRLKLDDLNDHLIRDLGLANGELPREDGARVDLKTVGLT